MQSNEKKLLLRQINQKKRSFSEVYDQKKSSPKSQTSQLPPISKDIKKLRNSSLLKSTEFIPKPLIYQFCKENSIQYSINPAKSFQIDQCSTEENSKQLLSSSQITKSNNQSPREDSLSIKPEQLNQKQVLCQEQNEQERWQVPFTKSQQKRIVIKVGKLTERQDLQSDNTLVVEKKKKASTTIQHSINFDNSSNQSSDESPNQYIQEATLTQKYQSDQSDNNQQKKKVIEQLKLQLFYPSAVESDLNKIDQNAMFNNAKLRQFQKQQSETQFIIKRIKNSKKPMQY